jgi:hypothetical protein
VAIGLPLITFDVSGPIFKISILTTDARCGGTCLQVRQPVVTFGLEALDLLRVSFIPCLAIWMKPKLLFPEQTLNECRATSTMELRAKVRPEGKVGRGEKGLICVKQLEGRKQGRMCFDVFRWKSNHLSRSSRCNPSAEWASLRCQREGCLDGAISLPIVYEHTNDSMATKYA